VLFWKWEGDGREGGLEASFSSAFLAGFVRYYLDAYHDYDMAFVLLYVPFVVS